MNALLNAQRKSPINCDKKLPPNSWGGDQPLKNCAQI